ncbi:MAG: dual specificity protein phosphatase family protein [Flammeovirgaceae bacterium]|nr:dual specificity protein phosphatase family protein [Flammeovirgaceae bacterium]
MQKVRFGIPELPDYIDRSTPEDSNSFFKFITKIENALTETNKVVFHCRMGIGRTSMVAAALLIKHGFNPNEIFDILSHHRTLSVPDTEDQIRWVKNYFYKR